MTDSEFSIVEKRDEDQILAELEGQVIEEYFYVTSHKKTVISYTGIKEIARIQGNIETDLVDIKETDTSWIVVIKATDKENGNSLLGTSVQSKLMDTRDGEKPDEFCYQKAFSKAQRNAIKSIIPEAVFAKALEEWNKGKKANKGGKPTTQPRPQPRRQAEATFDIMDFMRDKELKPTEWDLKDELNRAPESWDDAQNITETWLSECGFKPDVFKVSVNKTRIAVKANKQIPVDLMPAVTGIMLGAGFTQTKNLWRLQKSEVTG